MFFCFSNFDLLKILTEYRILISSADLFLSFILGQLNTTCCADMDCSVAQSECEGGRCQCKPGYDKSTCQDTCTTGVSLSLELTAVLSVGMLCERMRACLSLFFIVIRLDGNSGSSDVYATVRWRFPTGP